MDVTETMLPGVGMRYEFQTKKRQQLGIIVDRDGTCEIIGYRADDPDDAKTLLELSQDEAETVAEILGAPRFARKLADLTREIPGLHTEQLRLPATSRFVGETLGDTHCRTLTGASVVAIVRGEDIFSSPAPEQVLLAGDKLVVIGTASGVAKVRDLLGTTS